MCWQGELWKINTLSVCIFVGNERGLVWNEGGEVLCMGGPL